MTGMRRAALALGATLFAWAGPPVPMPPPYYEAPLWPLPAPGPVQPRGSSTHARPGQVRDDVRPRPSTPSTGSAPRPIASPCG